jgi:acetyl-CoA acetyltransferase
VGLSGIPIFNVNNNCATGSSALFLARQAVGSGSVECAIALGMEQMAPGALKGVYDDRPSPMLRFVDSMTENQGYEPDVPRAAQFFGGAGHDYMRQYGIRADTFGRISVKARQHAARNPLAVFKQTLTLDEVMASPKVFDMLTRFQCCPPTCGAAAAIVCSADFARKYNLDMHVVIVAQAMTTDKASTFDSHDMRKLVGYDMTAAAARQVYETAGIGPEDLDVVELHDCFTTNELITYEGLGLTPEGTAEKFILDGDNTYGGRVVTNPSGGLLSKGHPLGATGLAQCAELVWQLRGQADKRQVEGARLALQHNLGLGGACVVTLYQAI